MSYSEPKWEVFFLKKKTHIRNSLPGTGTWVGVKGSSYSSQTKQTHLAFMVDFVLEDMVLRQDFEISVFCQSSATAPTLWRW